MELDNLGHGRRRVGSTALWAERFFKTRAISARVGAARAVNGTARSRHTVQGGPREFGGP